MRTENTKLIGKIQKLKRKTRDRDIRIKLELFILALKLNNVSEACRRRGFGRTFYHKWWKRFVKSKFKLSSLKEKSRKPKKSPNKTSPYWENKMFELKAKGYGSNMIKAVLKRQNNIDFAASTINHILNNRTKNRVKTKKTKLNPRTRRYELFVPGERIQLDVKYVPKLIDGKRCYAYVAIDECTRWRFGKIMPELNSKMTVDFLDELFETIPFPIQCIQTDNGQEFTKKHFGGSGEHLMDLWCIEKNIEHKLIPPGAKELNGKVERSHRIDEQYFYWRAKYSSISVLNEQYNDWMSFYNTERPHQSLGWMTPKEKLAERLKMLPFEKFVGKIELARVEFLMQTPIKYWKLYGTYNVKLAA